MSIKENLEDVLYQIKKEKAKGKKSLKLKVYQCGFVKDNFGNTHPNIIFNKVGMLENEENYKVLVDMGYKINYVKTDQQTTARKSKSSEYVITKPLTTINMIIGW